MHAAAASSAHGIGALDFLNLLLLGILVIPYLGLLVYLIVAKKYGLSVLLLVVPMGIFACLMMLLTPVSQSSPATIVITSGEAPVASRSVEEVPVPLPVWPDAESELDDSVSESLPAEVVEHIPVRHHSRFPNRGSRSSFKGQPTWLFFMALMAGTSGIAWISNLLTQGYYRHTINYTLVTAIAVIAGLMVLMLLLQF